MYETRFVVYNDLPKNFDEQCEYCHEDAVYDRETYTDDTEPFFEYVCETHKNTHEEN